MSIFRVSQKVGELDSEVSGYTINAADLSDAQQMVLDREGIKIMLEKEIDYSIYNQRDKRYKDKTFSVAKLSYNYACFAFCLAFMVKRDPVEVIEELVVKHGINSKGLVVSGLAAEILGLDLLKGDDLYIPGKMNAIGFMPNYTCIKEVTLGKSQHFVVRIVDEFGKRSIFDPWTGKIQPVNFYPFKSYRLFKVK